MDNILLRETIEARRNWLDAIRDEQNRPVFSPRNHEFISARWARFTDLIHTSGMNLVEFEDYLHSYDPTEAAYGDDLNTNGFGYSE
jgi:hypothetical protein